MAVNRVNRDTNDYVTTIRSLSPCGGSPSPGKGEVPVSLKADGSPSPGKGEVPVSLKADGGVCIICS